MPYRTVARSLFCEGPFPNYEFQVNWFKEGRGQKSGARTLTETALEKLNTYFYGPNRRNLPFK